LYPGLSSFRNFVFGGSLNEEVEAWENEVSSNLNLFVQ
jgi:hypothetical protein